MADKMLWVASKDGTGWASNRTRDVMDVAFTVSRETSSRNAVVMVRAAWYNDPKARAKRIIGQMAFKNHVVAKAYIERMVKETNSMFTERTEARDYFLTKMLNTSLEEITIGSKGHMYACPSTGYIDKSDLAKATSVPTPVVTTTPAVSAYDPALAEWFPNPGATTPLVEGDMAKTIEEVQEIVEPVFNPELWCKGDPVPAGWINLGGKLTQIGWPS